MPSKNFVHAGDQKLGGHMAGSVIKEIGANVLVYDTGKDLDSFDGDLLGLIENSYDALCVADGNSRIVLLNRAFEKVMGLPVNEMMGQRILDIVEAGLTDTAATVKVLQSGREETVIINTSAGRQVISTGVPVYDSDHRINRVFCNLRNVADLLRYAEDFGQHEQSHHLSGVNDFRNRQAIRVRIATRDETMKQLVELAFRLAQVDSSVLLTGESGVGKDLLAKLLHDASPRARTGDLVVVNCGAIPDSLIESELFGYEPGAFTGASKNGKTGFIEAAEHGTLFLDEIGDLPLGLQAKLLSVLQERSITRLGGTRPKRVDVRIVAATNRDLDTMVEEGKFRSDLYYRLNVVPIRIPPLRERRDDVPFLLQHFLRSFSQKNSLRMAFSPQALEALCEYRWPGNVRELMNLVEYLVVTSCDPLIQLEHLPKKCLVRGREPIKNHLDVPSLKAAVDRFESDLVEWAVRRSSTREEAAHKLGISLSSLNRKLRRGRESVSKMTFTTDQALRQ
jgi:PAS domain S-box-containing protein